MAYDVAQDRENPEYVTNQGLVKFCVVGELDPGACAFSVDSVDWSITPVADMPSQLACLRSISINASLDPCSFDHDFHLFR